MMNLRSLVRPLLIFTLGVVLVCFGVTEWMRARARAAERLAALSRGRFIDLAELPGVSEDVLAAQGQLFRVEEPFFFDRRTRLGAFRVEVLSLKNFQTVNPPPSPSRSPSDPDGAGRVVQPVPVLLRFSGDAESLQSLANEIRLVNTGPARAGAVADGVEAGVEDMVSHLWQLLRHPVDTATKVGAGAVDLAVYLQETPAAQMQEDVAQVAQAYYVDQACAVAESHGVNYFELKTAEGRAAVESETNFKLGGEAALEVATILVPFAKMKLARAGTGAGAGASASVGMGLETAATMAEAGALAVRLSRLSGVLGKEAMQLSRAARFFPRSTLKLATTLRRLRAAGATESQVQVTAAE